MAKIWHIYKTDWKNIFKVPTVIMLIVALILLPSAYAWVNIKSMWDPYGNTSGIKVAVVNEDTGADIRGHNINVGNSTVKNLHNNDKLGWTFVNRRDAKKGVEKGKYYAYLIIPSDFSKKLASILEANPQKPKIYFGVNEKINAVAPKIATSGASSVTAQISKAFIEMVSNAIFSAFFKAGIELEKNLPSIHNVEAQIFRLEEALPEIHEMGNKAIELEGKLVEIERVGQKITELEQRIPDIQKAGDSFLMLEASLQRIDEIGERILILDDKIMNIQKTIGIINEVIKNLSVIETEIKQALDRTKETEMTETQTNNDELNQLYNELQNIHLNIQNTHEGLQQKIDDINKGLDMTADFIRNDWPTIEQKMMRAADFVRTDLPKLIENIRKVSNFVKTTLPQVERIVHKAADLARNDLPGFEAKIRNAADKLRKFEGSVNLNELIQLLKHDPKKESSFLANPIQMETKRIFPIPNYGSAMAPFYTMLALWVGATLLISSLRVDMEKPEENLNDYQLFFGRLLTFLTIGFFQAIIVSLGDLYLIQVYAADKLWFVLFSIFISMVFIIITYTLCSVFGNVGKGLVIIFLVLQISSSGATFPVSLTSSFFQKLNPFMPFTYSVSMLRETVGGMVHEVVVKDTLFLLVFAATSFLIALLLKKPLRNWIQHTADKAKSTKIIP